MSEPRSLTASKGEVEARDVGRTPLNEKCLLQTAQVNVFDELEELKDFDEKLSAFQSSVARDRVPQDRDNVVVDFGGMFASELHSQQSAQLEQSPEPLLDESSADMQPTLPENLRIRVPELPIVVPVNLDQRPGLQQ